MDIWFNTNPELSPYLARAHKLRSDTYVRLLGTLFRAPARLAQAIRRHAVRGRLRPAG